MSRNKDVPLHAIGDQFRYDLLTKEDKNLLHRKKRKLDYAARKLTENLINDFQTWEITIKQSVLARRLANISQKEVGEAIGYSETSCQFAISQFELGRTSIPDSKIKAMRKYYESKGVIFTSEFDPKTKSFNMGVSYNQSLKTAAFNGRPDEVVDKMIASGLKLVTPKPPDEYQQKYQKAQQKYQQAQLELLLTKLPDEKKLKLLDILPMIKQATKEEIQAAINNLKGTRNG